MQSRLTGSEISQLRMLAYSRTPMWGGVYESGNYDDEIRRWLALGLISEVQKPYVLGRKEYQGGFVITPEGRAALAKEGK